MFRAQTRDESSEMSDLLTRNEYSEVIVAWLALNNISLRNQVHLMGYTQQGGVDSRYLLSLHTWT